MRGVVMRNISPPFMTNTSPNQISNETDKRTGLMTALLAYTMWGFLPLFLKLLDHVPAPEILAHRIIWAVPVGAILITARRQWPELRRAVLSKRVLILLGFSSAAIAANWFIYIWAVNNGHVLSASLGYYINPLMFIATGVFLFGEKLRRPQIAAIIIAGIGVLVITIGAGSFP